jgi:hypothetical protein
MIKSVATAIRGAVAGWGKLERKQPLKRSPEGDSMCRQNEMAHTRSNSAGSFLFASRSLLPSERYR